MRVRPLCLLLVIAALIIPGCQSLQVEAGFVQPGELTATVEAGSLSPNATPRPAIQPMSTAVSVAPSPTVLPTPEVSRVTYQPPAPDGRLLTLEEARDRVRTFLGEPNAGLEGHLRDYLTPATGDGSRASKLILAPVDLKEYELSRQIPGARYPDEFKVDARTGEVTYANLISNTLPSDGKRPIAEAEARVIAREFASARFASFAGLTVYEEARVEQAPSSRFGPAYQVNWRLRASGSEAWLPTSVHLVVDLEAGRVVSYSAQRQDYQGPTTPRISKERAIEIALAEARRDSRLAAATADRVDLNASTGVAGQPQLVWFVRLGGVPAGSPATRHFSVDAVSGAVLNPLGSPQG